MSRPARHVSGQPRSRTISARSGMREVFRQRVAPIDEPRPRYRIECQEAQRPCPWVGCRHHLYLDVNPETGSIKLNFPDLDPMELTESCSLDVAERGGQLLDEVGVLLNVTRSRVQQLEVKLIKRIREEGAFE